MAGLRTGARLAAWASILAAGLLSAPPSAPAAGAQDPPAPIEVRDLGGSRAVSRRLETAVDLKAAFRDLRPDFAKLLSRAGWAGRPADLFRAIEEGRFTERTFPVGGRLQWMAYRDPEGRIGLLRDVLWAGEEAFGAFEVRLASADWRWVFIVPKACGNLALWSRAGTGELAVSVSSGELRLTDPEGRETVVRAGGSTNVSAPNTEPSEPRAGEVGVETEVAVEEGELEFRDYGHPISATLGSGDKVTAVLTSEGQLAFSVAATNARPLPVQLGDSRGTLSAGSAVRTGWTPPACALSVSPESDFAGRAFSFDASESSVSHGALTTVELEIVDPGGEAETLAPERPGVFRWARDFDVAGDYRAGAVAISDRGKRSVEECTARFVVKPFAVLRRASVSAEWMPTMVTTRRGYSAGGVGVRYAPEVRRGGVVLRWQTELEIDHAGFNLYRARGDGEPVAVNETLIGAVSRVGAGAVYRFEDRPLGPGVYRYWLESADQAGFTQRHPEPIEVDGSR